MVLFLLAEVPVYLRVHVLVLGDWLVPHKYVIAVHRVLPAVPGVIGELLESLQATVLQAAARLLPRGGRRAGRL